MGASHRDDKLGGKSGGWGPGNVRIMHGLQIALVCVTTGLVVPRQARLLRGVAVKETMRAMEKAPTPALVFDVGGRGISRSDEDFEKDGPWVALLLSYPNSGTTYTIVNTMKLTKRTTATVYAIEVPKNETVAVRPEYSSPTLHNPSLKSPGLVLTKTHCGWWCIDCPPAPTFPKKFERACRMASSRNPYGMEIVKKFVHLIRDPFDNCVARMHCDLQIAISAELAERFRAANAADPVSGLSRTWCSYIDEHFRPHVPAKILDRSDAGRLLSVPCHSELIRYVSWHNAVLEMTTFLHPTVPVHRLYYENYTTNYDETVLELYDDFLRYPPVVGARPHPFIPGKSYHSLFTPEHRREIAYLVESLASPATWQLLKHYFSGLTRTE